MSTGLARRYLLLLTLLFAVIQLIQGAEHYERHQNEKRQFVEAVGVGSAFASDAEFDYVVIGAGTGGMTIAARLAEQPGVKVAVIEAGTFAQVSNAILGSTPAGDVLFVGSYTGNNPLKQAQTGVDWKIATEPQKGANDRRVHYARGRCLGGTSARNFMIWQRPTKQSLDKWAALAGDSSYTWDKWLPYYKKSTTFTPPNTNKRGPNATASYDPSAFTANSGPLTVSYANYAGPFSSWMERAFREMGLPQADGFNSGNLQGSTYCASTIDPKDETRATSQTAFYNYAKARDLPLTVYSSAMAQRILFDTQKRASGVVVSAGLKTFNLYAKREVVLSGGAFHSPHMLMLSGIGPQATLQKFGIPVIKDAPGVGQGMEDHIFFGPTYRVKVETFTKLANNLAYVLSQFFSNYLPRQAGPLTNPVCDYLGWEKIPQKFRSLFSPAVQQDLEQRFPPDWPEIEYLSAPGYVGDFEDLFSTQPKDGYQYSTILTALVAPTSRGTVTLASNSANSLPIVDPGWLTSETDQQVAIAAFKRAREAFQTKAMAPVLANPIEYFPGPSVSTDSQILQNIRNTLMTVWHAACTCRMGLPDDPMAVVDSKARVYGVSGLRVVDASSFALLPPGHPQSVIYALAEKIADDIKADNAA